jgi:hypothetical protein
MNTKVKSVFLFVSSSLIAGVTYWSQADWWIYIDKTPVGMGKVPKFKLDLWYQLVESAIIGMSLGGILTGIIVICYKIIAGWSSTLSESHHSSYRNLDLKKIASVDQETGIRKPDTNSQSIQETRSILPSDIVKEEPGKGKGTGGQEKGTA